MPEDSMPEDPRAEPAVETPAQKHFPTSFVDVTGREWFLIFRASTVESLAAQHGLDFWKASQLTEGGPLPRLIADERLLIATLWHIVEAQAQDAGVTREAFADRFDGATFDAAFEAIQGALLVFFSGARSSQFRQTIEQIEWLAMQSRKTLEELNSLAREEHLKTAELQKAKFREAIRKESPALIDREISKAMTSARSISRPPAASASGPV
jgi:hypothetical protein